MSSLLVTLAVLVIVHNDMTFGHFGHHHFGHGPGHHHPGHHHPGHHHPGHHPGHGSRCNHGPGHPHGFPPGPEHVHGLENVSGGQEPVSEIRKKYAEILDIIHNSCRNNSIVPKIVYSTTSYVIIYNLPETKDLQVNVTIQNQILATQVTGTGVFKGFSDVRLLPDILKVSEAKWMFQGSDLKVLIPYKAQLGTLLTTECTPGNGSLIEVTNPPLPKIYLRMSEGD